MSYKIEKDIPLAPVLNPKTTKYPFGQLEIGNSFFVPNAKITTLATAAKYAALRSGFIFRCRSVDGGVRVWRIA